MLLWSIALLAAISGCSDNNLSNLQLNGDTLQPLSWTGMPE